MDISVPEYKPPNNPWPTLAYFTGSFQVRRFFVKSYRRCVTENKTVFQSLVRVSPSQPWKFINHCGNHGPSFIFRSSGIRFDLYACDSEYKFHIFMVHEKTINEEERLKFSLLTKRWNTEWIYRLVSSLRLLIYLTLKSKKPIFSVLLFERRLFVLANLFANSVDWKKSLNQIKFAHTISMC